jgi:hypothetical protein
MRIAHPPCRSDGNVGLGRCCQVDTRTLLSARLVTLFVTAGTASVDGSGGMGFGQPWRTPDGSHHRTAVRPVLPDEEPCG